MFIQNHKGQTPINYCYRLLKFESLGGFRFSTLEGRGALNVLKLNNETLSIGLIQ